MVTNLCQQSIPLFQTAFLIKNRFQTDDLVEQRAVVLSELLRGERRLADDGVQVRRFVHAEGDLAALGVLLGAVPLLPQLVDLLVPVLEAGLQAGQRALAAVALCLDLIKNTVNWSSCTLGESREF